MIANGPLTHDCGDVECIEGLFDGTCSIGTRMHAMGDMLIGTEACDIVRRAHRQRLEGGC